MAIPVPLACVGRLLVFFLFVSHLRARHGADAFCESCVAAHWRCCIRCRPFAHAPPRVLSCSVLCPCRRTRATACAALPLPTRRLTIAFWHVAVPMVGRRWRDAVTGLHALLCAVGHRPRRLQHLCWHSPMRREQRLEHRPGVDGCVGVLCVCPSVGTVGAVCRHWWWTATTSVSPAPVTTTMHAAIVHMLRGGGALSPTTEH